MAKIADDDEEDSLRDAASAPWGVSTSHADVEFRDRQRLITKVAREIARRSAHLNERLR